MAKLPWKCWHEVVTLRDDLKSGELPLHMFAADLYEVMMQSGKRPIYEDPEKFFALRSCLKIRSVGPACAAYGAAGRQRASEKVVGVAREAGESSGFVDAAQRRSTAFAAARSQDGVLRQLLSSR